MLPTTTGDGKKQIWAGEGEQRKLSDELISLDLGPLRALLHQRLNCFFNVNICQHFVGDLAGAILALSGPYCGLGGVHIQQKFL